MRGPRRHPPRGAGPVRLAGAGLGAPVQGGPGPHARRDGVTPARGAVAPVAADGGESQGPRQTAGPEDVHIAVAHLAARPVDRPLGSFPAPSTVAPLGR